MEENELVVYQFLHLFKSCLQKYFGQVSDKHFVLSGDRIHMILEELVVDGDIVESSIKNAVNPIMMYESVSKR